MKGRAFFWHEMSLTDGRQDSVGHWC